MACFDTTVFIDLGGPGGSSAQLRAADAIRQYAQPPERLCTTRFSLAELLQGVEASRDRIAERHRVDRMLAGVEILEFDDAATLRFAKIANHLRAAGTPIGIMDLLIASVALANGEMIVTRNVSDFGRIPGLIVHSY